MHSFKFLLNSTFILSIWNNKFPSEKNNFRNFANHFFRLAMTGTFQAFSIILITEKAENSEKVQCFSGDTFSHITSVLHISVDLYCFFIHSINKKMRFWEITRTLLLKKYICAYQTWSECRQGSSTLTNVSRNSIMFALLLW